MQRHLALLRHLFPLPKRRPPEQVPADVLLERARQHLHAFHDRNRDRAVQAITQKNQLQAQVDALNGSIQNLHKKVEFATERGDSGLAERLLHEKVSYEQTLAAAEETLQYAVETAEQVKVAIKREEENITQLMAELQHLKDKWTGSATQQEMQQQLERIGVWHLIQPPQPAIDRKTVQELVAFLLVVILVIVGLLIAISTHSH